MILFGVQIQRENIRAQVESLFQKEFSMWNKVLEAKSIPSRNNKSMIRIKLDCWDTKQEIFAQKKKLKGSNGYIDHDLTFKERQVAKNLRDLSKQRTSEGHTVKIGHQKLIIDGVVYYWNDKGKGLKKPNRESDKPVNNTRTLIPPQITKNFSVAPGTSANYLERPRLRKSGKICVSETWLSRTIEQLLSYLRNFHCHLENGIREHSMGPTSDGLAEKNKTNRSYRRQHMVVVRGSST